MYMIRDYQVAEEFIDTDGMTFVSVRVQFSVFFTQTQYEIAKYLSFHLKNTDFQCFKTSCQMYNLFNLNMDV